MNTQFNLIPDLPEDDVIDAEYQEVEHEVEGLTRQEEIPLSIEAANLAQRMGIIQAKLDVEMQRLENAGNAIAQVIDGITPKDQATYDELFARMNDGQQFLDGVEEFMGPWRRLFYVPYTRVLERTKEIIGKATLAVKNGKQRRIEFDREVKAAQARETARLQKEQDDRDAAMRLENAVTAEQMGMSETAVETILTQPSIAPRPVAAPIITRPQGMRKLPENWAAELISKPEFWAWARKQKDMPACLEVNQVAMNREAKTHKATLGQKYPGWRGVDKNS